MNIRKQVLLFLLSVTGFTSLQAQVWTLQQCIDTAQVYNKALQMSRNNIAISQQKHKEATANLVPKISANADYKYFTDLPTQLMPASIFGGPAGTFKEAQFGVQHNINANLHKLTHIQVSHALICASSPWRGWRPSFSAVGPCVPPRCTPNTREKCLWKDDDSVQQTSALNIHKGL